ncbi:MAG: hypothetical protein J6M56_09940 [Clostridia bacterium]|nr:hypothetical protein [Clostridia bacterium]
MFAQIWGSPYRFFLAAAVLAAILCLFPVKVDAPEEPQTMLASEATVPPPAAAQEPGAQGFPAAQELPAGQELSVGQDRPAGADLSERTAAGCFLHRTLYYAPCGHSVQRRDELPAQLLGMSRALLEQEIGGVIPGAAVTGFSSSEVDIALSADIPCPLHWVLRGGEDGKLAVLQNRSGETLEVVRTTDVPLEQAPQDDQAQLREGRIFDDVQALEGYLESLSS